MVEENISDKGLTPDEIYLDGSDSGLFGFSDSTVSYCITNPIKRSDGFHAATFWFENRKDRDMDFEISVSLDMFTHTAAYKLVPGESREVHVLLDPFSIVNSFPKDTLPTNLSIRVRDLSVGYEHTVERSVMTVPLNPSGEILMDVEKVNSKNTVCRIVLESGIPNDTDCHIAATSDGFMLREWDLTMEPFGKRTLTLAGDRGTVHPGSELSVVMRYGKGCVSRYTYVTEERPAGGKGLLKADYSLVSQAYIHDSDMEKQTFRIGSVSVDNRSSSAGEYTVTVKVDGNLAYLQDCNVSPRRNRVTYLDIPVNDLFGEYAHTADVDILVEDSVGGLVSFRTNPVHVYARGDIMKRDMCRLTSRLVNPYYGFISDMLIPKGGQLDTAVGSETNIAGWSRYETLSAVFDIVSRMRIDYISDTRAPDTAMQHVRLPDAVYRDRSGNCMDVSVFMASLLERLGFDPMILFPPGHAMVGVVTDTDMYAAEGCDLRQLKRYETTLDNGKGKHVSFVPIECTLINGHNDLEFCVSSAYDTVQRNREKLNPDRWCTLVRRDRLNGMEPLMFAGTGKK